MDRSTVGTKVHFYSPQADCGLRMEHNYDNEITNVLERAMGQTSVLYCVAHESGYAGCVLEHFMYL